MSQSSRRNRRAGARDARWPLRVRIAGGVLGALAGVLASRALRPLAHHAAYRTGLSAESVMWVIEITAPVAMCLAAGRLAERDTRRRPGRAQAAGSPASGDRLIPRHPPATAARN